MLMDRKWCVILKCVCLLVGLCMNATRCTQTHTQYACMWFWIKAELTGLECSAGWTDALNSSAWRCCCFRAAEQSTFYNREQIFPPQLLFFLHIRRWVCAAFCWNETLHVYKKKRQYLICLRLRLIRVLWHIMLIGSNALFLFRIFIFLLLDLVKPSV